MGRERRCQHARRRATDAIERQAELRLTDSRFDLVRDIRRVGDNDVSADRLELGHEFRAPDDADRLQATRFRESDYPPSNTRIGGVLHHPLARLQVDILLEQKRRGRGIYRQHRQLLRVCVSGQGGRAVCRYDHPLPPGEAGKRRQDPVAEPDALHSRPYGPNPADPFIADDGWKRGAECVDALRYDEVVRVDGGILDADQDLVWAGSVGARECRRIQDRR